MYRVAGRGKPPQLRSLTPRTPPVQPEPTPQGRRHWCRLTEKYCTRIAPPFQKVPLSPRNLPLPFSVLLSASSSSSPSRSFLPLHASSFLRRESPAFSLLRCSVSRVSSSLFLRRGPPRIFVDAFLLVSHGKRTTLSIYRFFDPWLVKRSGMETTSIQDKFIETSNRSIFIFRSCTSFNIQRAIATVYRDI